MLHLIHMFEVNNILHICTFQTWMDANTFARLANLPLREVSTYHNFYK